MSEVVARCFSELSGRRAHALEGRSTREEDPGRRAALHASPAARRPLWRCCRAAFKTECQTCQSQTTRIRNLSDGTARRGMRVVESSSRTQAVQVAPGLMIDHFSPRTRQPHSRSRRCASRMLRTNPPGSPLAFQVRCRAERPEELSSHARPAPLTHCVPPRGGTRRWSDSCSLHSTRQTLPPLTFELSSSPPLRSKLTPKAAETQGGLFPSRLPSAYTAATPSPPRRRACRCPLPRSSRSR